MNYKKRRRNTIISVIILILILTFSTIILIKNREFLDKKVEKFDLPFTREQLVPSEGNEYILNKGLVENVKNVYTTHEDFKVRGIYVNNSVITNEEKLNNIIEYAKRNDINSFVIDVKDDIGNILYHTNSKYSKEIKSNKNNYFESITPLIKKLEENNIYPIARIVCFKDPIAKSVEELCLKQKNGEVWLDNKGNTWLNPYDEEVYNYLISISKEAALLGFRDIQYDYVRFPSDGKIDQIDYSLYKDISKSEAINNFISKSRDELNKLGATLSIDTFGLITSVKNDSGIGQELVGLVQSADVLCPMIYPSHYYSGNFGVKYPNSEPYIVANVSMKDAINKTSNLKDSVKIAKFRPWIQAFSAPWLKRSHGADYLEYGGEEINLQISGLNDAGVDEWILWNASSNYKDFK